MTSSSGPRGWDSHNSTNHSEGGGWLLSAPNPPWSVLNPPPSKSVREPGHRGASFIGDGTATVQEVEPSPMG